MPSISAVSLFKEYNKKIMFAPIKFTQLLSEWRIFYQSVFIFEMSDNMCLGVSLSADFAGEHDLTLFVRVKVLFLICSLVKSEFASIDRTKKRSLSRMNAKMIK